MELGTAPPSGRTVVVIGASGSLGRRVVALVAADPEVGRVVTVEAAVPPDDAEVKSALANADVVLHLGDAEELAADGLPQPDVAGVRSMLDAAAAHLVPRLVVLSSAVVYGAWPNNPVPLTEEAPLRPEPGYEYAAARAEVERLVLDWRRDHPDARAAVLRATVSVDAASAAWFALSPWTAKALRVSGSGRPSQFLHLDDLAAAIDHARHVGLDGAYNVAPDGWLSSDALAELAGPVGRVHLPAGWLPRLRSLRTRIGFAGPPAGTSYTEDSWVVANDRLRATGWEPTLHSDEVYVEADPGGPLASMSPRRRQELSLAGVALALVSAVGGAVWLVRRRRRTRERGA
jgi:nucleoside-diphosphate-sugar epimerase